MQLLKLIGSNLTRLAGLEEVSRLRPSRSHWPGLTSEDWTRAGKIKVTNKGKRTLHA